MFTKKKNQMITYISNPLSETSKSQKKLRDKLIQCRIV